MVTTIIKIAKHIAQHGTADTKIALKKQFPAMRDSEADKLVRHAASKHGDEIKNIKSQKPKDVRDHAAKEAHTNALTKDVKRNPNGQDLKGTDRAEPTSKKNVSIEYGHNVKPEKPSKAKIEQVKTILKNEAKTPAQVAKKERAIEFLKKAGVVGFGGEAAANASTKGTDGDGKDKETKADIKSESKGKTLREKLGMKKPTKEGDAKIAKTYDMKQKMEAQDKPLEDESLDVIGGLGGIGKSIAGKVGKGVEALSRAGKIAKIRAAKIAKAKKKQ